LLINDLGKQPKILKIHF